VMARMRSPIPTSRAVAIPWPLVVRAAQWKRCCAPGWSCWSC
jgi:hypothetical protein